MRNIAVDDSTGDKRSSVAGANVAALYVEQYQPELWNRTSKKVGNVYTVNENTEMIDTDTGLGNQTN